MREFFSQLSDQGLIIVLVHVTDNQQRFTNTVNKKAWFSCLFIVFPVTPIILKK